PGAARPGPGRPERLDLGVRRASLHVDPLADDRTARRNDDGADHRVRRREPPPPLGELERPPHEAFVARGHPAGTRASTNASGSNGWRSSMRSPTPISLIGTFSSRTIRTTIPPLAGPSTSVGATPVRPVAS